MMYKEAKIKLAMYHENLVLLEAESKAGYREIYAMKHGKKVVKVNGNHVLIVFTYSADDQYQDANGATYDVTEGRWVA